MDIKVLQTQQWLNSTYGSNPQFVRVDEDGLTGNGTVKGLIRGLQIELGESTIDGIFGNGTYTNFNNMFPNGLNETTDDSSENVKNIIYILKCGFYCRGINPETFNGFFGIQTSAAVREFQMQARNSSGCNRYS